MQMCKQDGVKMCRMPPRGKNPPTRRIVRARPNGKYSATQTQEAHHVVLETQEEAVRSRCLSRVSVNIESRKAAAYRFRPRFVDASCPGYGKADAAAPFAPPLDSTEPPDPS